MFDMNNDKVFNFVNTGIKGLVFICVLPLLIPVVLVILLCWPIGKLIQKLGIDDPEGINNPDDDIVERPKWQILH